VEYRIVGPDEFNIDDGKLSMDSPLGKALLGKHVEDEIRFSSPRGVKVFYISNIRYVEKHST
jgi:transcription elongation factor GreB